MFVMFNASTIVWTALSTQRAMFLQYFAMKKVDSQRSTWFTCDTGDVGCKPWKLLLSRPVAEMPFSARFGVTTSVLILGVVMCWIGHDWVVWFFSWGMLGLRSLNFAEVMIFISPFDELPVIRAGLTKKVPVFNGCKVVLWYESTTVLFGKVSI